MTSGEFHSVAIDSIIVNRDERQRRELTDVDDLADSIRRLGLINPPVITRELVLVAGERRLAACRFLGWTHIAIQWVDELDPDELRAIELEENIKRVDLEWKDECVAIKEYHQLKLKNNPDWTQDQTAEALGLKQQTVSAQIIVAEELEKGDELVVKAGKYSTARGIIERRIERAKAAAVEELEELMREPEEAPRAESICNEDFLKWAPAYAGPRFNFIHCDFPYGIGADKFNQGAAPAHGGYDDTATTYWSLIDCLLGNLDRFCAESAHLIFWFSMDYYTETVNRLRTSFTVLGHPLIWFKSDNIGILPDPQRGPRRVYETALFCTRGDRKVVQAVSNAYAAPSVRDSHMSEKSESMLRHFFRMTVDEFTVMLDPTCGSGSAIRAAESLGAKGTLGLELNPEFADRAKLKLAQSRTLKELA